jgi:hypothetical protein
MTDMDKVVKTVREYLKGVSPTFGNSAIINNIECDEKRGVCIVNVSTLTPTRKGDLEWERKNLEVDMQNNRVREYSTER